MSANDYYPFGPDSYREMMPGRKYSEANTQYRYGFNGKELDKEINGNGSTYNFGSRVQESRLGRFFSIDNLNAPYNSGYSFAGNSPIASIDYNGNVEIIVTTHSTGKDGKIKVSKAKYVIETVEDIRGITRDVYKIDIYQREALISQKVGNATHSWYGWKTSAVIQDKESGKTPEERQFAGIGGWVAKNLYELSVSLNPVAKLGDALGYDRNQVTGEFRSQSQRAFQVSEAILDVITLGRGTAGKEVTKKVLGKFLKNRIEDYAIDKIISYSVDRLGFDKEKSTILGYHLIRMAMDAKKGEINDVYKFLQNASSIGQKTEEAIKELNNYGIDLNMPKNGKEAVSKVLQSLGTDQK